MKKRSQRITKRGTLFYLSKEKYLSAASYALTVKCYAQKVKKYLLEGNRSFLYFEWYQ